MENRDETFQRVQKYEKGTNRVSASVLFEIAQALSISMDDFFKGAEAVNPQAREFPTPPSLRRPRAREEHGRSEGRHCKFDPIGFL